MNLRFRRLLAATILFQSTMTTLAIDFDPVADPAAVVVSGNARFTILGPRVVRMELADGAKFEDRASFAFIDRNQPLPAGAKTSRDGGWLTIETDALKLRFKEGSNVFTPETLSIDWKSGGKSGTWKPGLENAGNLRGTWRTLDGVSGASQLEPGLLSRDGWTLVDDSTRLVFENAEGRRKNAEKQRTAPPTPSVTGPGDQKSKIENRKSEIDLVDWRTTLTNQDFKYKSPWVAVRDDPKAIDWYFFAYGSDYKQALKDFTAIAGPIPLPPRWAFGGWWSRYWAYSDPELRQLVSEFQQHGVPLDVLVVDMDWHLDGWTGYTWNPKYFPDPAGFLKWCHEQGLKVTLNLHPADGVGKHEDAFAQFCKHMGLDPATTDRIPFDCTDPKFMWGYFRYLHHPLEEMGIDFWWMDWQQGKTTKVPGLDPLWWLNHLHWDHMERNPNQVAESNDEVSGERGDESKIQNPKSEIALAARPLVFSRWGGLGNHRYQIGFSGDTYCDWPSLAFQPAFTATAGNVGYGYWSHDIGGHQPGKVDPELYTRWIQWGALSPILRTHTTKNPAAERRIWEFPEPYYAAMKKAWLLRYDLIPYIYTQARKCTDESLPLCRPLYYEWPDVEEAYNQPGEYLYGDDLLIAPVVQPADPVSGCASVTVWFPPGEWVSWYTGRVFTGPSTATLLIPLDEIPLFARAGAIIPMAAEGHVAQGRATNSGIADTLVLNVFPGASGATRVYVDDGASTAFKSGGYAFVPVKAETAGARTTIAIGAEEGRRGALAATRAYEVRLRDVYAVRGVKIDGVEQRVSTDDPKSACFVDSKGPDLVIRTGARQAGKPIQIVVERIPSPALELALHNGLRGHVRLCEAVRTKHLPPDDWRVERYREVIFDRMREITTSADHPTSPDAQATLQRAVIDAADTAGTLKMIQSQPMTGDEATRLMMQLLGLATSVKVSPSTKLGGAFEVTFEAALTSPFVQRGEANIDLKMQPPKSWNAGAAEISKGGGSDGPLRQIARFSMTPPANVPQTAELVARVEGRYGDYVYEAPLRTLLVPSINAWWIAGPFEPAAAAQLDGSMSAVATIDAAQTFDGKEKKKVGWRKVVREIKPGDDLTNEFFVNFTPVFGGRVYDTTAYAVTFLKSPRAMTARLAIGSDDGNTVWLNGEKVHEIKIGRAYGPKQDLVPIQLKAGTNVLVLRVDQQGGDWGFGVHLETPDGRPLTEVDVGLEP